jgi:hypothetical protein
LFLSTVIAVVEAEKPSQVLRDLNNYVNMATDDITWALIFYIVFEMQSVRILVESESAQIYMKAKRRLRIQRAIAIVVGIGMRILMNITVVI